MQLQHPAAKGAAIGDPRAPRLTGHQPAPASPPDKGRKFCTLSGTHTGAGCTAANLQKLAFSSPGKAGSGWRATIPPQQDRLRRMFCRRCAGAAVTPLTPANSTGLQPEPAWIGAVPPETPHLHEAQAAATAATAVKTMPLQRKPNAHAGCTPATAETSHLHKVQAVAPIERLGASGSRQVSSPGRTSAHQSATRESAGAGGLLLPRSRTGLQPAKFRPQITVSNHCAARLHATPAAPMP